jgi:uncharacterized small protein (DUF1192 family)
MTTRIIRAPHAIDEDSRTLLDVMRARDLRDRIAKDKAELDRLKESLAATLREQEAQELTVGGVPVVRVSEFDRQTVKVSELLARFPAAAVLVNSTPVIRVELP